MNLLKQQLVSVDRVDNFFARVREALDEYMIEPRIDDRDVVSFALALPRLLSTLVYHQLRYYPDIKLAEHMNKVFA